MIKSISSIVRWSFHYRFCLLINILFSYIPYLHEILSYLCVALFIKNKSVSVCVCFFFSFWNATAFQWNGMLFKKSFLWIIRIVDDQSNLQFFRKFQPAFNLFKLFFILMYASMFTAIFDLYITLNCLHSFSFILILLTAMWTHFNCKMIQEN